MTDYIINPMWFYLLNTLSGLRIALSIVGACGTLLSVIAVLVPVFTAYEDGEEMDEQGKAFYKKSRLVLIVFAIVTIIGILMPGKETILEMMIASVATKTNAALTLDGIKQAVDYIVEAIGKIK